MQHIHDHRRHHPTLVTSPYLPRRNIADIQRNRERRLSLTLHATSLRRARHIEREISLALARFGEGNGHRNEPLAYPLSFQFALVAHSPETVLFSTLAAILRIFSRLVERCTYHHAVRILRDVVAEAQRGRSLEGTAHKFARSKRGEGQVVVRVRGECHFGAQAQRRWRRSVGWERERGIDGKWRDMKLRTCFEQACLPEQRYTAHDWKIVASLAWGGIRGGGSSSSRRSR
mmetsp:Transcript_13549/g.35973  ORF Transcript_13549/g.35973 Transcript_13549/m.35973 type:complete len:231 (+) Transcript_13549:137-829(+)